MMKKLLLSIAVALTAWTSPAAGQVILNGNELQRSTNEYTAIDTRSSYELQDGEFYLGYCNENDIPVGVGNLQPTNYEAAIHITGDIASVLEGHELRAIRVGLYNPKNATNGKVWIKSKLDGEPLQEQACDFTSQGANNWWFDIPLDTPYVLDGNEFYIGYSLTIAKIENQGDEYPIGTAGEDHPEGFYMRNGNYAWANYNGYTFGRLTLQGVCFGDVKGSNATMSEIVTDYMLKGEKGVAEIKLVNTGGSNIHNIDVEYAINGKKETITNLDMGNMPRFTTGSFKLNIAAPEEAGEAEFSVKITKVNGEEDADMSDNEIKKGLSVLSQSGTRKVVVEEATGLWCGFCPRGAAGLDRLARDYADETVCIAVHGNDIYQVSDYLPLLSKAAGYPSAIVNRTLVCDPYFGTTINTPFGIATDIEKQLEKITPVDVKLELNNLTDSEAEVKASVTYHTSMSKNNLRLAYVLIEDGLLGDQQNYYSGNTNVPEDLKPYADAPQTIIDCELNHVARAISSYDGINYWEEQVALDETKEHVFKMNTTLVKQENSRIAVLVIDEKDEIINADEVELVGGSSISSAAADAAAPSIVTTEEGINIKGEGELLVEVFAVNGTRVASGQFNNEGDIQLNNVKGAYVVRITNGNQTTVQKVIF